MKIDLSQIPFNEWYKEDTAKSLFPGPVVTIIPGGRLPGQNQWLLSLTV
jgi:hypothetical protein